MRSNSHIHTCDDGRGRRLVMVDGKPVEKVFYADTRKGVVRYFATPMRLHKRRKRAIERTKRGKVEIEFI